MEKNVTNNINTMEKNVTNNNNAKDFYIESFKKGFDMNENETNLSLLSLSSSTETEHKDIIPSSDGEEFSGRLRSNTWASVDNIEDLAKEKEKYIMSFLQTSIIHKKYEPHIRKSRSQTLPMIHGQTLPMINNYNLPALGKSSCNMLVTPEYEQVVENPDNSTFIQRRRSISSPPDLPAIVLERIDSKIDEDKSKTNKSCI